MPIRTTGPASPPALWLRLWRRTPARFVPDGALEAAQQFLQTEAFGGIVLVVAALAALLWVNSPLDRSYFELWHTGLVLDLSLFRVEQDLQHLVNDGLMALFFFVVGLEIKRELVRGELSDPRRALLPAAAALGGMIAPALIYVAFNPAGESANGWGIPMATDIAFAIGVLSLISRRVPFGVKIFLLSLAIVDDMGAILVIAVFYTEQLDLGPLLIAAALFLAVVVLTRAGFRSLFMYMVLGGLLWVAMLESGVHATLTGVALALVTPSKPFYDPSKFTASVSGLLRHFDIAIETGDKGDQEEILAQVEDLVQGSEAPLERFERTLHPWVSYLVMPVFALANAGVVLSGDVLSEASSSAVTFGVATGLILGKLAGITLFSYAAVRLGICSLPTGASWAHVVGVALLGGIGFTVSLFVTGLAFDDPSLVSEAKIGIFAASVLSGALGLIWLTFAPRAGEPSERGKRRARAARRAA